MGSKNTYALSFYVRHPAEQPAEAHVLIVETPTFTRTFMWMSLLVCLHLPTNILTHSSLTYDMSYMILIQ